MLAMRRRAARPSAVDDQGGGPTVEGEGSGWLPPAPDPMPAAPRWINGRAFPAAWRETTQFAMGGLLAAGKGELPMFGENRPWNHRPANESDADIDQAIGAKIHVNMRLSVPLAAAQLVIIEPSQLHHLPHWRSTDEALVYAAEARLPVSPLFLDLEASNGQPVIWESESWPFPFHLRGALCWQMDGLLNVVPFGSVGGRHPWGGSDYQAWTRWQYIQSRDQQWPDPGPGDFIARASGEARCWVDLDEESICSQQGRVSHNLNLKVLSILKCIEAFDLDLMLAPVGRQVRRNAERKGEKVGLVPKDWPLPVPTHDEPVPTPANPELDLAPEQDCPIPQTHARLNQSHTLWHEALEAYANPDRFAGRLNALIPALRSVTFVLQKELRHQDGFDSWYMQWQEEMRADRRMAWLITARNKIEKQGDLDTHSKAHVRVVGDWSRSAPIEIDADPMAEPQDIARRLTVQIPARARREGTLIVERRWTVDDFPEDEILDILAYCFGFPFRLIEASHQVWGTQERRCELSAEAACDGPASTSHPSGRMPCMVAGREARTARRNLGSGAPVVAGLSPLDGPPPAREEAEGRYGPPVELEALTDSADVFDIGAAYHQRGRKILLADGYHESIAWLLTPDRRMLSIIANAEDHREKYLGMEQIALKVDELGADRLIFTSEAWQAFAVPPDDPRAELRPTDREDRTEVFFTVAIQRGVGCREWLSQMSRTESGELRLADSVEVEIEPPPFLEPVMSVWEHWSE